MGDSTEKLEHAVRFESFYNAHYSEITAHLRDPLSSRVDVGLPGEDFVRKDSVNLLVDVSTPVQ